MLSHGSKTLKRPDAIDKKKSRILSTERRSQVEWNPICWVYGKIKCNIRGRRALYWLK